MQNAGLDEAQAGIKITRKNISNLRYADDTTLMAESEEEVKSLFMKVKNKSEKVGLKLNTQKSMIMASCPINSRQIDGETMEAVTDFISLGSKITADGDSCHEIKRHLLLERKAMTNLDSILKSRDVTLPTKVHLVKAMIFLVVMYGCESECEIRSVVSDTLQPVVYTVLGILQTRILEWVAVPFSRWSSQPRDGIQISHIAGRFFTS